MGRELKRGSSYPFITERLGEVSHLSWNQGSEGVGLLLAPSPFLGSA